MVEQFLPIEETTSSCESWILVEKHRDNFPKGVSYREKTPLELVHVYLSGSMKIESLGWSYYFITYIDDYNKRIGVYFLTKKSKTLNKFQ